MDPSRKTPDMSPVDRDGGDQSESIFQPTEKTDEEKTKRLTSAEETAPPTTNSPSLQDTGANSGQEENPDESNAQPPLEDQVTNTGTPSVDECVKDSTDSKCDRVKDSLSHNVQVQIETTNNSDEKSSVAIESSSSSFDRKKDDENVLIPNKPQLDCLSEDDRTPSLSVLKGTEKDATKDDMQCGEGMAPILSSEGECERQKPLSPSSEEKLPSTSEEKTHSSPSEEKPPSTSEGKTQSSPSEEKPPSKSEEKTHSSPSEEKPPSTSQEKTPSKSSENICDEIENSSTPSEENILSASSKEKDNDGKTPSSSTERCDEKEVSSPSSEENSDEVKKVPNLSSESLCDEDKTVGPSEEKCVKEKILSEGKCDEEEDPSLSKEEITPSPSSEKKCDEVMSSSPSFEEKCNENLSSSPPSEDKYIAQKAPSSSTEQTSKEEMTPKQSTSDEKYENSDFISNSCGGKVCPAVSNSFEEAHSSSVESNGEQKPTECSSDVRVNSFSELVGAKVDDENEGEGENLIIDEESQQSTAGLEKCKNTESQESNDLLEKCEDAKISGNVCQLSDESEKMPETNNEDNRTNKNSALSPVDAEASADIQCSLDTKLGKHDLLEVDGSNSKNEPCENEEVTVSDKIDKSSDRKVVENEVDKSTKSDIEVSQNKIADSIIFDDSTSLCAEDSEKVKNYFSINSTELVSSADLSNKDCDKSGVEKVPETANEETSKFIASVSKFDEGLNSMKNDILTSRDEQLTSNPKETESNTENNSNLIILESFQCAKGLKFTTIEKSDDSGLLCHEIMDKSEVDFNALSEVANFSKETLSNLEDERVDDSKRPQNVNEDSKICSSPSNLAKDLTVVKTGNIKPLQSSSGGDFQSTLDKKLDSNAPINVSDENMETTSSVEVSEELAQCVNNGDKSSKDDVSYSESNKSDNSGNSGRKSTPSENIQIMTNKKVESNVSSEDVVNRNEKTKTATVEIEETFNSGDVNKESGETDVFNSQPSIVNKESDPSSNASIQNPVNKKFVTDDSLVVVNNASIPPCLENIVVKDANDSSSQIDEDSGGKKDISVATPMLGADIQNTVKRKSGVFLKRPRTVRRKSVKCGTNAPNSRVNRNPLPILPRPPIASTSTFVGNFNNTNSVPVKVSKATTTDTPTEVTPKPLILSKMDIQRIAEMKPTNPQVINPDQLHKNICIIKTSKPGTQDGEKEAKPKKVSIDCQVDESELSPVAPYQAVVNELSARKGPVPAISNPNNHIVVTVRGTFANAASHPAPPSIPVRMNSAGNTAQNQERISEAVKFFFQGPTNLDRFFAPNTRQPNSVEAAKICQNVVPSAKEQGGLQQASFEQDRNRKTTSKKKTVTDKRKFTPILPKPPGMQKRGECTLDQSQKLDGQVIVTSAVTQQTTTTLLTSCGEVKISVPSYALEGGSKLQQVVDKLYLAQESVMPDSSVLQTLLDHKESGEMSSKGHQAKVDKIDFIKDSSKRQVQPTKEFLSNLKLPSNLTVIPQKVKKQRLAVGSVGQTNLPLNDKVEGSVFARLQKLGTVIEVERDGSEQPVASRSETSSPSATPITATQPDYAQCLRVLDNLTQAGQILASIKKVNPKTAAKSKMNLKPLPNLKKIEVPSSMTNKPNLQRRSSLPSEAINRSSPGLSEPTAIRPGTPSEISSRVPAINFNENEHCLKIASNPELTIIHTKHLSQGPSAAKTPPPVIVPVVTAGIDCPPLPKILHFEQQLNCPPTISITTEESGGRKEAEKIDTFRFQLDVSQVREKSEGERVLNCDICSAEYPKVASLKRHYLRKHINVRYISDQDKQNYLAPSKNKNAPESSSQKSNTEEDESMKGLYKCSSCRKCFDEKNDLKNHMFEQHILGSVEFKTFDCSKCSNTFDNIKEFVAHRKICSQKPAPPPPPISLQFCLYCEQSFVNIAARNKHHYKSHHFKKKYQKCFICSSDKYRDKSSLFKHMCIQHKEEYFGCQHCHFRFGTKADLDRHNHVKHGLKKAGKKTSKQSSTNEEADAKSTNEDNKIEDNQLPCGNRLESESSEVVEKVENQTKLTKNGNSEINSKYELAKMLVRVGPPNATDSEILDYTKATNKKKPEPKAAKDNKSKSEETEDVSEKEKSESSTEENVVENNAKVETGDKVVESNAKVEKKKKKIVSNNTHKCSVCSKIFGSIANVARHKRLAHGLHPKRKSPARKVKINQNVNVFTKSETGDESEHTVLHNVYGNAENSRDNENNPNSFTRNVKENLLHHLDGKLDSQEVMENDLKSRVVAAPKRRLSFSASFPSSERTLESESKDSQDSKEGLQPISPKSSIEKYSFPKNYDGCGGLTSYFKDMSHLDLFTQKAMRFTPQNACFENEGASASEFSDIPTCLELVKTERSEQEDEPCVEVEFSGEWTRPRRYICAVCNFCTGELWEIEDHKLALHPNVWCPHNEVLVEEAECWRVVYRNRHLTAKGVLGGKAATSPSSSSSSSPPHLRCTKCNKVSATLPDFHRHVLDCGGDTTWAITMLGVSSPGNRRNRKWRPFGSRRRRQQGRRGLKRNIPNTPAKQPGMKIRTKPGDMETIQRMIANLPAKRVSRRVFGDDNEVKTRSQGTISSGSIYSTPFTYQFNNKTAAAAALAKKQAAKLLKPKILTNGSLIDSPKKEEKKMKLTGETTEKPQNSKTSPGKELSTESPTRKKLKSPDKNKFGTSERKSDTQCKKPNQCKNALKRDHSKVDKNIYPGKEDNSGALDAKKKQKLKHNVFNVEEGSSEKNIDKTTASGKNKLQTVDSPIGDNKSIVEANKNEKTNPSTSVSAVTRPKAASKPTKHNTDKQKRSSDDFRKSLDDFRKRMCIDGDLIMCSGCGTQFDNSSACQRHMKKCSYCTGKAAGGLTCAQCNTSFSSESLKQAHVCDDRAMPQLSPEEPYPEQVPAATEDIPVLSPEEIGKNKNDDNSDVAKKGLRLTRSESRASIPEAVKNEKRSSEEGKPPSMTKNSRSGLRQKILSELNKSVHDETNNLDSINKQIGRVLRHRSITNLSSPDDDGDDSKTTGAKSNESSDVSAKNQQKSTVARGRKRPLDEDDAETDNDKDDEENSVRRETRRGQIANKSTNQGTSNLEKDEVSLNESRRKSMRLSLPSESTSSTSFEKKANESERTEKSSRKSLGNEESRSKTENNVKKISFEFMKETSETGERQGKRFLCEVCDKIIMEIYLRKHVEGGAHSRNVEMRGDFDNLFPDPGKFITSCNICNLSFSSPFMSYKHQLHNHEDALMELIESSMIEPMEKEAKEEVVNDGEDDDDESLIKTKQKLMSKKYSEEKPKMDDSSTKLSWPKVDSKKSKTNRMKGVDAPSTETEKPSTKRKSVNSLIDNVNEKAGITSSKVDKKTTGSSFNDVTIKSEDIPSDNSEKRALRARRNSLPNESTTKSEDSMILNPELTLLREGRRSSLRLDSSLGKAKETIECQTSSEKVFSNNESTKESTESTDLQLRGRRNLTIAGSSGNVDTKDTFNSTQITKSLSRSSSINDSIGGCENGTVMRSDFSTKITSVTAPSTESTDKGEGVVHEASEFVNKDGKTMMFCFICDRSVGKSAYKKHSNSVIHKQNTKFRKEFQEKYADSKVMTCKSCQMDFTHSYLCFRHSMELHPEAVVIMFDSIRTTRSLSSKEEKQVTVDDSNKKIFSNKETPTTQILSNNKTFSKVETPSLQSVSNKKTPISPSKAKNESTIDRKIIDPKKTGPTISTSKDAVQTTMFEFFKKAPTLSMKEDATALNNTNEASQKSKTTCSKKSPPISCAEKLNTVHDIHKKNVDENDTPIIPTKVDTMTSPFDFINETSAPILSYREVTQSKSKNIDNNRKVLVNTTVSTKGVKDDATFDSNQKSKNPVLKVVPSADSSKKSSTSLLCADDRIHDNENEKIVIPKVSPSTEMASKTSLNQKTFNTPESSSKELTDEINSGMEETERVTESGGTNLASLLTPLVDPVEVKPANTLFCASCHKRVKIESLQKHSTSSSHKVNYDQSNFDYEVPADCDKCQIFENFPFACRAHQKSVLKSKKRRRKTSDDECSKKLVKSLLGKMSKKKLNKLKKRQKLKQSEKLAETKINRLKKMKINNWQVSVVKKDEGEKCEKKATSTATVGLTSQQVEFQSRNTSEFDCLLCNKHFNSALLLVEHQNTTVHKMNASRHALQNNPLPILPSTIIPSLAKTVPPPPPQIPPPTHTPPQQVPSPKETDGNFGFLEQTPAFSSSTNVSTDQDLTQAAGEAILAYGWQDTDWSSVRNMSGWDNQSVAGSSSSGIPDTNMSAFWDTDVTSSFMGGRSSLGSILDSVNKILADPDVSTDSHYNLTDLQSEVGAYHDDMLGERSSFLQDMSMRNETSTSNSSSVQDNWSYPPSVEDGSTTTLMNLDNQQPTPPTPTLHLESDNTPAAAVGIDQSSKEHLHKRIKLSADVDKIPSAVVKTDRSKRKPSVDSDGGSSGSSKTRAKRTSVDYESRETLCPTCGRHFLGLMAVQFHMASCSNISTKSGASLSYFKRRVVLNTPFDSSLVCQKCKEILNSPEAFRSHDCEQKVKSDPKSRSDKSDNADPINKEGAEKFKSKMSIALGTLLDKALNNLLGAKSQEPDLNTGAIQLLGKLCAVRRKSQQNLTSAASGGKSSSSTSASTDAGGSASQISSGTNFLDYRTLNYKTTAKLRSLMAGEHNLPKLPWLTGGSGGVVAGGSSTSTAAGLKPAALPPSPETLVDHLAMMLADGKSVDNSYACPVCSEKFSMPSARNNHMYLHQEAAAQPRPVPGSNPDERSQSSQNQNNSSEKDWRAVASSSSDSDFGTESGDGQQSTRLICPECDLAFSNLHEILLHRKETHHNTAGDLPVSENIVDSTSGDENRGKKSKRTGGGASKGGGEKSVPGLEPIRSVSAQAAAERLRKRPMKRGGSQEESVAESQEETVVKEDVEEDDDEEGEDGVVDRRKANKTASKQRLLVLAPEDVRVKAEAALRELSLQKNFTNKGDPKHVVAGSCKYGSYRYSQNSGEIADNAAMVKARFASIIDKKWKLPGNDPSELSARRSSDGLEEEKPAAACSRDPKELEQDVKIGIKVEVPDLPTE